MRTLWPGAALLLAAALGAGDALAGPSRAGLWQYDGYMIGPDDVRMECDIVTMCEQPPPGGKDFTRICAAADAIAPFAVAHMADWIKDVQSIGQNCTSIPDTVLANGRESEDDCEKMTVVRRITQPDDTHLTYEIISRSLPPVSAGTLRAGGSFTWVSEDCTSAGSRLDAPKTDAPPAP